MDQFSKILIITLINLEAFMTIHGRNIGGGDINTPTAAPVKPSPSKSNIFRAYIGSDFKNVKFSDVPIRSDVDFHFILAFAIDYTTTNHPSPTNGIFNIFWDNQNLTPDEVIAVKNKHKNVKVVVSIGGDSCRDETVFFKAEDMGLWVSNAVSSLTKIVKDYDLDGIDVDYEQFKASPTTFAGAIGQVITQLKSNGVISIASIAPFDDPDVQSHYQALWKAYGHLIDYVNFQFYAYDKSTTVSQFIDYFDQQSENYNGGNIIASFATDGTSGGLSPENGFFEACKKLKSNGKLAGIFIWSADFSKKAGFPNEKESQALLVSDGSFNM